MSVLTGSMKTFLRWRSKKENPNGTAKLTKVRKQTFSTSTFFLIERLCRQKKI